MYGAVILMYTLLGYYCYTPSLRWRCRQEATHTGDAHDKARIRGKLESPEQAPGATHSLTSLSKPFDQMRSSR